MSKAYDLEQKSNFSTTASNFKTEPESETSNFADSAIQSAVNIKIEKLEGRQRRVFAKIQIPYPLEQVWQVLTEYDAFAEFMPSMSQIRRLEAPDGGIRLEQTRTKSFMGMQKSFRSVFDVEEKFPHEIHYRLVEGDMKAFTGYWQLEAWQPSNGKVGVDLIYNISVLPKPIIPAALFEHVLSKDVPATLLAVRQRVEDLF